jgi:hypothetical protein
MSSNVTGLCGAWLEAKRREDEAKEARIKIEEEISQALDTKTEGAVTHKVEPYKVTLIQPIYRKIDLGVWETVKRDMPAEAWPIKVKIEVDDAGCKWLAKERPDLWSIAAKAITATPGKIGVKVVADE